MTRLFSAVGATVLLLLLTITTVSAQSQGPADLSAEELRQLRKRVSEVVVIDVRTTQEYEKGHIAGAINISSKASNQFRSLAQLLPRDKKIPLVFYCRGFT